MKKLLFIPALLSIAILFSACGKEEVRPDLPDSVTGSSAQSSILLAVANESVTRSLTFKLSDFSGSVDLVKNQKYITRVGAAPSSFIEFTGITAEDLKMSNVSLTIRGRENVNFPFPSTTIEGNDKISQLDGVQVGFMTAVMEEIVSNGTVVLEFKYTPSINMTNDNAKVTVHIDTRFYFN